MTSKVGSVCHSPLLIWCERGKNTFRIVGPDDMLPGRSFDVAGALTAVWNMVDTHAAAYDAIKANDKIDADHDGVPAMVSIAHHMRAFYPVNPPIPQPWPRP